jgi:multidrug efflux pump subunit AcrA (membrane-fusion protein)
MTPEQDARVAARLAKLQGTVAEAEAYLADKQAAFDKANNETGREVADLDRARQLVDAAKNALRRAQGRLGELLVRIEEEEERLRLRAPPAMPWPYWPTNEAERAEWRLFEKDRAEWQAKMRHGEFPPRRL